MLRKVRSFVHEPTHSGGRDHDMSADPTFMRYAAVRDWDPERDLAVPPGTADTTPGWNPDKDPALYLNIKTVTSMDAKPRLAHVAQFRRGVVTAQQVASARREAALSHQQLEDEGRLQTQVRFTGTTITGHLVSVLVPFAVHLVAVPGPASGQSLAVDDPDALADALGEAANCPGRVSVREWDAKPMYGYQQPTTRTMMVEAPHPRFLRRAASALEEDGWAVYETPWRPVGARESEAREAARAAVEAGRDAPPEPKLSASERGFRTPVLTQLAMRHDLTAGSWVRLPIRAARRVPLARQTDHVHAQFSVESMEDLERVEIPGAFGPEIVASEDAEARSHRGVSSFPDLADPDDTISMWCISLFRLHWDPAKTAGGLGDGCVARFCISTQASAPSPNFITVRVADELELANARRRILVGGFATVVAGYNTMGFDFPGLYHKIQYHGWRRGPAASRWFPSHVYGAMTDAETGATRRAGEGDDDIMVPPIPEAAPLGSAPRRGASTRVEAASAGPTKGRPAGVPLMLAPRAPERPGFAGFVPFGPSPELAEAPAIRAVNLRAFLHHAAAVGGYKLTTLQRAVGLCASNCSTGVDARSYGLDGLLRCAEDWRGKVIDVLRRPSAKTVERFFRMWTRCRVGGLAGLARLALEWMGVRCDGPGCVVDADFLGVDGAAPSRFEMRVDKFRKGISKAWFAAHGRVTLDLYWIYQETMGGETSYSLDAMTRKLLTVPPKIELGYETQARRYAGTVRAVPASASRAAEAAWAAQSPADAARKATPAGLLGVTEVMEYCDWDAVLPALHLWQTNRLPNVAITSRVSKLDASELFVTGQMAKVFNGVSAQARARGYWLCVRDSGYRGKFQGATVLEPRTGLYREHYSVCLDFTSLYPSQIIAHNLCWTTLLRTPEALVAARAAGIPYESFTVDGQTLHFVHRSHCKGVLPAYLEYLLTERKRVKKAMKSASGTQHVLLNARQLALKVMANSSYGYTGNAMSQFCCLPIAVITTLLGRTDIERSLRFVHEEMTLSHLLAGTGKAWEFEAAQGRPVGRAGLAAMAEAAGVASGAWDLSTMEGAFNPFVFYGDTDSIMVQVPVPSRDDLARLAFEFGYFMARAITGVLFGDPDDPMDLKFEYVAKTYMMIKKKMYASMASESPRDPFELNVKGIDGVKKRSTHTATRLCLKEMLPLIVCDNNPAGAALRVQDFLNRLLRDRIPIDHYACTVAIGEVEDEHLPGEAVTVQHNMIRRFRAARAAGLTGSIQEPDPGARAPMLIVFRPGADRTTQRSELLPWAKHAGFAPDRAYLADGFRKKLRGIISQVPQLEGLNAMADRAVRIARAHQVSGRVADEDMIRAAEFCPALFPDEPSGGGSALGALRTMVTPHAMMKAGLENARARGTAVRRVADSDDSDGDDMVPPTPDGWEQSHRAAASVIAAGSRKHARDQRNERTRKRMRGGRGKHFAS